MAKKLLFSFTVVLWILILAPGTAYGQCPTSVSISADPGTTICAGTKVSFTATANGSTNPSFQWQINSASASTGATFSSTTLNNGDKVRVIVTSSDGTTCSTASNELTMTVNPVQTPTVSISTTKTSICPGESITFNTSNTFGGTSPTYQWFINSSSTAAKTGASATFSSSDFVEGNNTVRVVMTSNFNCANPTTAEATSAAFELKSDATISTPTNNDQTVCINTAIQNIAFALGGGATNATVTGLPSGITGSLSGGNFVISGSPTTNGTFSYTVTTTGTCAQKTATGTITVNPDATIALTSGNNMQTVCATGGVANSDINPITYSIGETGTGATVTGLPTGITGSFSNGVYTIQGSSSVTGAHNYTVKATGTCGDSAPLTGSITITANKVPSVSITSSDADNTICAGTSVTFTATPTNGGTNPTYQWKVNNSLAGTNSSTFTTTALTDGQVVTVDMSSSETCLTIATVTSNPINTTVNPNLTPEVTIVSSDSDICPNDSVTFTATPVHGGSNPTYQWKIGNTNVGTDSPTFSTTALTDGQSVSVVLTSSETCLATSTATSNSITTTVQAPAPSAPGAITGPEEVCATATDLKYSIAAVTDAESYTWRFPTGWSVTSGQGTRTATFSASSTSGNISVVAINSCGTSAETSLAVTSVDGVLPTPGNVTAPNLSTNAICPPATGIEFNVPSVIGADSYLWTLPNGWEITSGSGTNAIVVKVNSTAATTANASVSVQAVNICGNSQKATLSGIAVDNHVITDSGADQTVCMNIIPVNIEGNYSFSGTSRNLKPTWSVNTGMGSFGDASKLATTFTPTQAALDAGSVVLTLTTEAPSGACGPGTDEMTIFFKPLPAATITAISPVCSGNTSVLTFTGTPNSRVTYKQTGGTNQTVDIGSSGSVTVTTPVLTSNTSYELVSSINLDTPACTNTLSGSTTITVTPKPTANISYAGPFCSSLSTAQSVTLTGTGGYTEGTYSSTTGLSINTSTGAITPDTSTPGTYTVTYSTPEAGGCEPVITTTEVTITKEPTAAISYAGTPFCTSDSVAKTVTLTGTDGFSGGIFSAPTGLTIDSATGAIAASSSTAGTYTVTYKTPVADGCAEITATTEVTITNAPTASIEYAGAPFCHSVTLAQAVTLTGTDAFSGGIFTAPTGLSINSSTGAVTPASSTPGTYEVIYTIPSSDGCGEVITTTNITITETPAAQISYNGPYCTSDATVHLPVFTNTAGKYQEGVFRSTPDGLSIDPVTGAINAQNSSPNTYTVFYELPAGGGCGTSEIQTSVSITQVPQLDINYTSPLCTSDKTSYAVSFSANAVGAYQGGTFTATTGLAIDSAGNIIAANSTPGIHTVTYTTPEANGCGPVVVTTDVEIFKQVLITSPPVNTGICSTEPASFEVVASGDNLVYQWKRVDGAAITNATGINTAKLSFSNATATNAGEYYVQITGSSPCNPISSDPVTLNVDENIVITKPTEDLTFCDQAREGVTFEFIAHADGAPLEFTWVKDGADIPYANTDRYTFTTTGPSGTNGEYSGTMTISGPNPSDNGVYAVRINGPDYFTCADATSKTFTLNVTPLPEPPTTAPVVLCQGETAAPLTASGAAGATFKWYTSTMEPIVGVPTPSTVDPGNTSYYVTQTTDVCESNPTELVVTVNPTPAVPTTQEALIYCFEESGILALSATGTDVSSVINWYGPNDSSVKLTAAPIPLTTSTGNTKYWVSQSTGDCESDLVEIVVTVKPLPELVVSADSQNICEGSSTILHASGADTYVWTLNGTEIGTTADITVTPGAAGSYTYTVTGTDTFGCINTNEIIIDVETPSKGGIITGPSSVCTGENTGLLTLSEYLGDIVRWESSTDGTNWTSIAETSAEYTFQNLAAPTQFRAVVKNGVCNIVYSDPAMIKVDPDPVAGGLLFKGTDRIFMMCEFPTSEYLVPLMTSGTYVGEIVAWQYRRNSDTQWRTVLNSDNITNYTGPSLSGQQVMAASNNESTIFRVEVQSGACSPNVYSEYATLSIIPSDIAPNPVTASPGTVCLGESISLSSGTGYGGYGVFNGGAFDNSSIANHGWRVKRFDNDTEYTFQSAADNTRPERWMRTNPHDYIMANPNGSGTLYQRFDSSSGDEGNKGFAIVSGNNPSTLETPVFNTYTMDNPTLTFDQAYNLTPGDTIKVQISLDGGTTYVDEPLFVVGGPAVSGNYDRFGDDGLGEPNNMVIDLSQYAGLGNLRIRWLYDGSTGGIYTIDDIGIPQDPQNVQLIWYYDADLDDPNNVLEQIGEINQGTVTYTPTKIGWNYFEVQTALVFDTNGDPCKSAENFATIQVYVFDTYTTTATAEIGSCGDNSVSLSGVIQGASQGVITEFPVDDRSTVAWEVISGPENYIFAEEHFTPSITDPNAIFDPGMGGNFTLQWTLTPDENSPCVPIQNTVQFEILDCVTLDFDGIDDRVVIEASYPEAKTIEAWIRPEAENGPGTGKVATIISTQSYELYLNASFRPVFKWNGKKLTSSKSLISDERWYHLAVSFDGSTATMYIDGLEIKDASSGNETTTGTGNQMIIGARYNGSADPDNYYSGWIEEVRIWNTTLNPNQIRFMMNQHLINNGAQMGEQIPMDVPNGLTYANLSGYYRLISQQPDPLNLETFDTALMPTLGETPDLAVNSVPGRLYNMTTHQQNTAPLPYLSKQDGQWIDINTWQRPNVWDIPNADGVTNEPIDWNIVKTFHNITSEAKDITVLGLKSETQGKLITMANPSSSMDEKNSGQMMRVTHYLLLHGNMDLVGESQLLQDEGSILAEESAGWLERDQQGKRLSFNYNYWSSPVSAQGAANNADYSVNQVLLDGTDSKNPRNITFDNRYHAADKGRTNPITISNYWIWKFLGTADIYEEWFHIGSTGTLATGEGYTMKGTDGTVGHNDEQNYVFKGKPHNGDFTRAVSQNQNYLVGNPYPSAIDAKEFILDNMKDVTGGRNTSNIFNGAIYYWDHFAGRTHYLERYIGGYATWTLAGGVVAISNDERILANDQKGIKAPGQYVPVAQGFFVNTVLDEAISAATGITVSGGPIEFKNRQRIYERETGSSESIFHSQEKKDVKTATSQSSSKESATDTRQKIWLKFKSPMGYHRQLLVTADPNTTDGFDLGYDAPMIEDNDEDLYWYFNNYEFVIQAVEDFNVDRELDLGMKVHEEGQITISIDELRNIPDDLEIFLKDSLLQVNHDLRKTAYRTTSDTGTFHNRFKVIFEDPTVVVVEEPEVPEEGEFEILYVNGSREILVRNPKLLNIERIYLNNVLGQQIHVYYDIPVETELKLPVKRFSSGVYIVKVHSEKGIRTKKVILE